MLPPSSAAVDALTSQSLLQFERDEIGEEELLRIFFADGRPVDGDALKRHMVCSHMAAWMAAWMALPWSHLLGNGWLAAYFFCSGCS